MSHGVAPTASITLRPTSIRCWTLRWPRASVRWSLGTRWAALPLPPGRTATATKSAAALINTTTGDLVRKVKLLSVPRELSPVRVLAGRSLVNTFGGFPLPGAARALSRHVISTLAVAADADPSATRLVYELFTQTSAAGRGGCAKMLVEEVGSAHLNLDGLTVPTLVIGGVRDRLTPISQSRRIARTAPNVVGLVELPGGHCSMLERHQEVNSHLRALAESVTRHVRDRRISS